MTDDIHLPNIRDAMRQLGTKTVLASWVERARVHGSRRTIEAMEQYAGAVGQLWRSLGEIEKAKIDYGRARRALEDADDVFEYDRYVRQTKRIGAKIAYEDAVAQDEIAAIERQKRLQAARGTAPNATIIDNEPQSMTADAMREMTNFIISEYTEKRGGKANLTPEDKEYLQALRQRCEEYIKEAGLG